MAKTVRYYVVTVTDDGYTYRAKDLSYESASKMFEGIGGTIAYAQWGENNSAAPINVFCKGATF